MIAGSNPAGSVFLFSGLMSMKTQIPLLSQKKAFLFDYGDTLVQYYNGTEFFPILRGALAKISNFLVEHNFPYYTMDILWERAMQENYESKDYRVRPLSDRLKYIFQIEEDDHEILMELQRLFLEPIHSIAILFEDTLPTLRKLKLEYNVNIAIVSNTPWGSPSILWKEEIIKFGLDPSQGYIDFTAFCVDVGWRKPAPPIFQYVLNSLDLHPQDCVFIGDNPRWDIEGPRKMNIDAILLDRNQKYNNFPVPKISRLEELFEFI